MFDRFTERVRKVIQLAREEAMRFNHDYIGTEHLLLEDARARAGVGEQSRRDEQVGLVELPPMNDLALVLAGRGERDEARRLLEKVLELKPGDPRARQHSAP